MASTYGICISSSAVSASQLVSASRGVLALQGTGLSGVDIQGAPQREALRHAPVAMQDKPNGGWRLVATATGNENPGGFPVFGTHALRVHPANVIRTRHICRTR